MTLTFSDEALEKFKEVEANEVASKAVELFRKRWHNNYKLNEYLRKGEAETPKAAEGQTEGETTEPNPTRDN